MTRSNIADVEAIYCVRTAKAIGVWPDEDARNKDQLIWFPLSQVEVSGNQQRGGIVEITAPQSLFEEKGMV